MKPFVFERAEIQGVPEPGDWLMHGDVVLHCESKAPEDFDSMKLLDHATLAEGEAHGHYHRLFDGQFELREDPTTKARHLKVVTECFLRHQEHKEISVPPGNYRIGIQKEYDPFEKLVRRVVD